jgi:Carboxypeptidase regulatory-like domain
MTKKRLGDRTRGVLNILATSFFRGRGELSGRPGRHAALALVLAAAGLTLAAPSLTARKEKPPTTKTVRGQVLDAQDNGIVGAAVEMTDVTTGKKAAIYTEEGGHFVFTGLKTFEDYEFRATEKGKSSETRKVSSWDTRMRVVVNLHIPPPKE